MISIVRRWSNGAEDQFFVRNGSLLARLGVFRLLYLLSEVDDTGDLAEADPAFGLLAGLGLARAGSQRGAVIYLAARTALVAAIMAVSRVSDPFNREG